MAYGTMEQWPSGYGVMELWSYWLRNFGVMSYGVMA